MWPNMSCFCIYLFLVCGKQRVKTPIAIIGGKEASKGKYPWQVALYRTANKTASFICGGTLLSERIIVTGNGSLIKIETLS